MKKGNNSQSQPGCYSFMDVGLCHSAIWGLGPVHEGECQVIHFSNHIKYQRGISL